MSMLLPSTDCQSIIQTALNLQKGTELKILASNVYQYQQTYHELQNAICQHGIACKKMAYKNDPVKQISSCKSQKIYIEFLCHKAIKDLKDYQVLSNEKFRIDHNYRRQHLENIIQFLKDEVDKNDHTSDMLIYLAEAYLYRSALFRAKGRRVPSRKLEALKQAIDLTNRYLKKNTHLNAYKIWAQASLEYHYALENDLKLESENTFEKSLDQYEKAAKMIYDAKDFDLNDLWILLEYAENAVKKEHIKQYIKVLLNEKDHDHRNYVLYLFKARAALLSGQNDDAIAYTQKSIDQSPDFFSDPYWDMLIKLLRGLKNKKLDWKPLVINAYHRCSKNESIPMSNIYLRWYWAGQKQLYDLAFLAANSPKEKARIADSLKSRPALRYQAMHQLRHVDTIKETLEQENKALGHEYLKKKPAFNKRKYQKIISESVSLENFHENWVAVHFYLNELEVFENKKGGYACIYNSKNKSWEIVQFDYQNLYQKALAWQSAYYSTDMAEMSSRLIDLCEEMGNTMPFLFDSKYIPKNSKVLFIPHGFLHRLPLHAAIKKEENDQKKDTVFLENHASKYLPAWHQINTLVENGKQKSCLLIQNEKNLTFKNIENELKELEKKKGWEVNIKKNASPEDLEKFIKGKAPSKQKTGFLSNPAFFIILCHGHGDVLNPLKSWLELTKEVSVADLLAMKTDLQHTTVLLGACESDMAPPIEHCVDEHISLSTVFLTRDVRDVIAGLWIIEDKMVDHFFMEVLQDHDRKKEFSEELRKFQIRLVKLWKAKKDPQIFYRLAPYRVMGFSKQ